MNLGVLSISLSVKNLNVSKAFYEKLGFTQFAGNMDHKYLIMKNGDSLIGLFEGMFEGNIITFNPGWDTNAQLVEGFDDVRSIQKELKEKGIELQQEKTDGESGPGSFVTIDPDGNVILIDQHV